MITTKKIKKLFINKKYLRTKYLLKINILSKFYLKRDLNKQSLNKLFLFFEFLIYNFQRRFTKDFLKSSYLLFLELTPVTLNAFFEKFKVEPKEEEEPKEIEKVKEAGKEEQIKVNHEINEIITSARIKEIIKTLKTRETIRGNDFAEQKLLLLILTSLSGGTINYHLKQRINEVVNGAETKNLKLNGFFSETSFFQILGLELINIFIYDKYVIDINIKREEFEWFFSEGQQDQQVKKSFLEKLQIPESFAPIVKFTMVFLLAKKTYTEMKTSKFVNNIVNEFFIKIGGLFFSFLRTTKINNKSIFIRRTKINNESFKIKKPEINKESILTKTQETQEIQNQVTKNTSKSFFFKKKETNYLKIRENFHEPFTSLNIPSFKNSLTNFQWHEEKIIKINLFDQGVYFKIFKTETKNNNMKVLKISQSNKENISFINKQGYFLNKKYSHEMFKTWTKKNLELSCLFYNINLKEIEQKLNPYDFERFVKFVRNLDYTIRIRNNNINLLKTPSKKSQATKIKKVFEFKNQEKPTDYKKGRNSLFLEIQGKKVLLKSIISQFLILESFSTRKIRTSRAKGKEKTKTRKIKYFFSTFLDTRNRLYLGNNILSPMSNQKFADFLKLENKIKVLERSNLFQKTYEKVKSFDNFFSSSLNPPENLDFQAIFEKFTEDHKEMLDFIKRNNWEKMNFKTFFEKSKKERVVNKDIFAEFAVFLDCVKFLKNPYTCLKKFFCLDSSSSGIQISGLLINSQQLLTFSNIVGNEKSEGYKKMRSDLFEKFFFLLENFSLEFFSYQEKTFDFFSDLSKNYFLITNFNLRELVFIAYFIQRNKSLFYSFFNIETIKTGVIGQIYGMTRTGIEKKMEELLINSFNKTLIFEIEKDFLINEEAFSLLKESNGSINKVSIILEDLKKNQERLKKQTSFKVFKRTLKRKIKFYENLNKAKEKGDKNKPIRLKAVLTKLYLNLIRKSKISDNFTRIKPIFESLVSIHKLSQQTKPFIAENENFKFSLEYPLEVSHRINIKTYKYNQEKQIFKLGKRRQITIKKKGEGFDYKKLKLAISANFIQNIDSEILNNFVDICKNLSLPVYICHDKFGLPYMFNIFLRPIVSEAMLKISWEQKLLSFCRENGLKKIETKTINTNNDFLLFYLHLKIKFLIYPKIFAALFKDVKKNKKAIFSNVLSSTELLENFQKEGKRLDLKIRDVNYNFRNNFTNPFFIKK